jgi:methionine salvage enolase-phosphatase E1
VSNEQRDIVQRINAWIEEKGYQRGHLTGELLRGAVEEITRLRKIEADAKAARNNSTPASERGEKA